VLRKIEGREANRKGKGENVEKKISYFQNVTANEMKV